MTYPTTSNVSPPVKPSEFDWSEWVASFPELENAFPPHQVAALATRAALYFTPGTRSVVGCPTARKILYYLLIAHWVCLQKQAQGGDTLLGPLQRVTEGSLSLSVDTSGLHKIDPWLSQTRYGQEFWALSRKYRSTFYIQPITDPRYRIFP
ncbi:hypothetical protein COMNV_01356 [Commensalibacter sp. Nvir]|uniref:DUF4054 domain-containing protein n=1 Tax=Commensalibacter sp. Nvir TaxID=3069817 RepID=UPI002D3B9DFE|nr:hypothetical protein COMNV_01356 [Commensalibacter sp. Nvir]